MNFIALEVNNKKCLVYGLVWEKTSFVTLSNINLVIFGENLLKISLIKGNIFRSFVENKIAK